jgi:hypothetical protein
MREKPSSPSAPSTPAHCPAEEALMAMGMQKPLSFHIHKGTVPGPFLNQIQTPPTFDFWNARAFRDNIHHVVKHLLDFKHKLESAPRPEASWPSGSWGATNRVSMTFNRREDNQPMNRLLRQANCWSLRR